MTARSIFINIKCLNSLWEHHVIYVTGIWSVFGSNVLLSLIFYSCLAFTNVRKMALLYHLTDLKKMYRNYLHVYPSIAKQIIIVTMHMYSSR